MPYATLEALRAAVPASGSTDHEDHTRGIVDALIDGIRKATVTLSSADLLALDSTPVELVAAPGAGKWLNVHRVVGYYSHGTTEYVATGGLPFLTFGSTSLGEFDCLANQDAITLGWKPAATSVPWTTTVKVVASEAVNAALVLSVTDPLTDGDGTLTVTVWYSIEDVP